MKRLDPLPENRRRRYPADFRLDPVLLLPRELPMNQCYNLSLQLRIEPTPRIIVMSLLSHS